MSLAIVWFRRDLRLADNPALHQACREHAQVLPLYIHAPEEEGDWASGAASRWWLHRSLGSLDASLRPYGGALHIRHGDSLRQLLDVIAATGARAVYWNRLYEPAARTRDTAVKAALREHGVQASSCNATLWCEPWQLASGQGTPYRVFTPFWRALRPRLEGAHALPLPGDLRVAEGPGGSPLATLGLQPTIRWDAGLAATWAPGEAGAHELLDVFADDALAGYAALRDRPARHGTSHLSPHLHFGEISARQLHAAVLARAPHPEAAEPFLRQLGWREFAHHVLYHFPDTPTRPFDARFGDFRWAPPDPSVLERWQRGRTGIPLVDAGMRELWQTGWMHNRVRMVVASLLTKNLRQHWLEGARWFWDTLVDADLANNTLGWQWVAGCGVDAAPYFRVFNPVAQARTFDPDGAYLRRWLPELADAPLPLLHEPWRDPALLRRSGYPAPIVDLAASRQAALAAYRAMRA